MKIIPQIETLKSELSERTLTLNLILTSGGQISLRSCEVIGKGFRHRTSFQNANSIGDVLVDRLVRAISDAVHAIPDTAHVLSLPEFLVEMPGLVLSGAHVMMMEIKDGCRNAIFRFKEFMGGVNHAFLQEMGFHEPYSSHAEKLATNVLADICLPLLNLCRQLEFSHIGVTGGIPSGLNERLREFEFQTELLKRFVFNAGIGHARPSQAYLQADASAFALTHEN